MIQDAIFKIVVTIYVSPEYVICAEESVIGLEQAASKIASLLPVIATPFRALLALLAAEKARVVTIFISA